MSLKRPADDTTTPSTRPRRQNFKRIKVSPVQDDATNSSEPSSGSVSEDSALRSSPQPSNHTRNSSVSSLPPSAAEEDDSESSVSSSSSEGSDLESEDEAEITTIGRPKKPLISREGLPKGAQDLMSRLEGFLPQMSDANKMLEGETEVGGLEDVEEGEQYIEMSLGLGVLEEQQDGSGSSDESESNERDVLEHDLPASSDRVKSSQQDREADVLGKLMGQSRVRQEVGIQDAE